MSTRVYTIIEGPSGLTIRREQTGKAFKMDDREPEYSEYYKWLKAGGTPGFIKEAAPTALGDPVAQIADLEARLTKLEGKK